MKEKLTNNIKATPTLKKPGTKEPVARHAYDNRYFEAYCNNPKAGKKQALIDAGYVGKYATQESCRIHKRVFDKIDDKIKGFKQDIALLSYHQMKSMLKKDASDIGYSNMNTALKNGLDYTGHKPTDHVEVITKADSLEEIEEKLEAIRILEEEEAQEAQEMQEMH